MLYTYLQHPYDTINKKTQEDFFTKNMHLSLYYKGSKRVTQSLRARGSWWPNINCNILTPLLWPSTLCLSCSPDAGVHSAGCWLSLLHLISIFSGPQLIRAPRSLRPSVVFPTTFVSNWLQLNWHLTSVLTELYNSSTPTRSPIWSLKSHV